MNIDEHKFSDDDIEVGEIKVDSVELKHWRGYGFTIKKDDVIALTKHFDSKEK